MSWMIQCWATCLQRSLPSYMYTCSPVPWTTGTPAQGAGGQGLGPLCKEPAPTQM